MSAVPPVTRSAVLCIVAFMLAVAGPLLLNLPVPPAIGYTAQIAAVSGWGLVLMLVPAPTPSRQTLRSVAPLFAVLAIMAVACTVSILTHGLPSSPGVATLGLIALAAILTLHGASWGAAGSSPVFKAFAMALLLAGLCGVVMAVVQIFDVEGRAQTFIALPPIAGRASGNLGQANQFADTLLWALLALLALAQPRAGDGARSRGMQALVAVVALSLVFATALSGSRTALVCIVLMALWGIADRGLAKSSRILLATTPVAVALMIWLLGLWSRSHAGPILLEHAATDVTAFRGLIWSQSLQLIANQPWLGVGWGQFNFAWTLTPFTPRSAGLVSNAHNLPLQLAVEVGVPVALLMIGLLGWALWSAARRVARLPGPVGLQSRAALMVVVVLGVHSLLEYPLWFAYLLFPVAWAWGFALGTAGSVQDEMASDGAQTTKPLRTWRIGGLMMLVTGASAWFDYLNLASLYVARPDMPSFEDRIRSGQQSPLFSYMADYVATTHATVPLEVLPTIERSAHVLFNGWLLVSWGEALAARGELEKARYLAARLREFDLPGGKNFFAPCADPAVTTKPWQCTPPTRSFTWHDFEPS